MTTDTTAPKRIPPDLRRPSLKPPPFLALRSIVALILREMSSTYGSSPGGYIWAVLKPVGTLLILSLAFSLLVRAPSLGTSFILFYATGYLPFSFYSDLAQKIGGALGYSRALLAYPRVSWIDAVLSRFILNILTSLSVFIIVITGVLLVENVHVTLDIAPIIAGLGIAALFGTGVGLVNGVLGGLFPVWVTIWSILSRPMFLASGIFYTYEDLPRFAQDLIWWNPVIHSTGLIRTGFYTNYEASYVSLTYGYGISLVFILLGLIFMRANYIKILEI